MIAFWIGTIILLAISCVFVLYPLLKPKEVDEAEQRDDLNKAFFRDRLAELESEDQAGIVGNKDDLVLDLKQSLLDDIPVAEQQKTDSAAVKWMAIPLVIFMAIASYGVYALYGAHSKVAHWKQVENNLPVLSQKLMNPQGVELTEQEMTDLTLALRSRLQYNADDATGWVLLGRIGLANRDIETAIGALTKADNLMPNNQDVQLSLAQALMFSSDQVDLQKADSILAQLIKQPDVDLRVYSLLAFSAYESGDYAKAIDYWKALQDKIGKDDDRYDMLSRSIKTAQRELDATNHPEQKTYQGTPVKVTVSLSPEVKLPESGVLIVSVHTADGAPMPVAAARYPISQFPVTVVLDDSNSMIESRKLSSLSDIMVKARIDSDGNVATREGDWHGESLPIHLGDDAVISIEKKY
ncbi:c-type cytochrome biogenesis protein CcmI [Vibrio algivorus]|uniref:C-type cytochrome biogenesis protein CcmI n=1 Tax=Vibrio algivorus TaxID=1667024 RepID=A0A557PB00_9VIBR|nr:c-type cytochrome biogenesis protein CcmI [Vibrio algivorus]TVO37818.1 c-type cytochrome biogenesis protein CcmI [Vibrio algivorus]GLT16216.1 cytochrome C biogenesis protein CcmI [Vibrio algivorus]